jgi:hypothetical protein
MTPHFGQLYAQSNPDVALTMEGLAARAREAIA